MFWSGILIMFLYIIFKKFDRFLSMIINPIYRKCWLKTKQKTNAHIVESIEIDRIKKHSINREERSSHYKRFAERKELKQPLLILQNGLSQPIQALQEEDEEDETDYESNSESNSESSDVYGPPMSESDLYGPGPASYNDTAYNMGEAMFGVQMDFIQRTHCKNDTKHVINIDAYID